MLPGTVFDRFVAATPVAVATRGLLEHALLAAILDALFQRTAQTLLTNLSARAATAATVAKLSRERWTIEGLFLTLTTVVQCEVITLAYPKAALFGFCVALASSNVYATVKASLRAAHVHELVDAEVSDDYLADELAGNYRGMMIAIPTDDGACLPRCRPRSYPNCWWRWPAASGCRGSKSTGVAPRNRSRTARDSPKKSTSPRRDC